MARVLLVDHNHAVLRNLRAVLTLEGLDVCGEALNGKKAIEEATRLMPDIIVLDQSLPDLTGLQTAYEIRQRLGNVKIVFFTLRDEATISAAAHVVGADAFVSKSSPGELVLALRRLVEQMGPVGLGSTNSPAANPRAESAQIQAPLAPKPRPRFPAPPKT